MSFVLEIAAIASFLFSFFCWINSLFVLCPDKHMLMLVVKLLYTLTRFVLLS